MADTIEQANARIAELEAEIIAVKGNRDVILAEKREAVEALKTAKAELETAKTEGATALPNPSRIQRACLRATAIRKACRTKY